MVIQPDKLLFIRLNESSEIKIGLIPFFAIIFLLTILTLINLTLALFSVPLFLSLLFAALSEKIEYRTPHIDEEE